jgi:hypothetical protein
MQSKELHPLNNQKGQVFLEFILILMILISVSFGFMEGIRYLIGTRWETMVKIIAVPNQATVKIP